MLLASGVITWPLPHGLSERRKGDVEREGEGGRESRREGKGEEKQKKEGETLNCSGLAFSLNISIHIAKQHSRLCCDTMYT